MYFNVKSDRKKRKNENEKGERTRKHRENDELNPDRKKKR